MGDSARPAVASRLGATASSLSQPGYVDSLPRVRPLASYRMEQTGRGNAPNRSDRSMQSDSTWRDSLATPSASPSLVDSPSPLPALPIRHRGSPQPLLLGRPAPSASFNHHYDWKLHQPRRKSRERVFAYALLTAGGKFTAGYGAYIATIGLTEHKRAILAPGLCVTAIGLGAFYLGAHSFSRAIAEIKPNVAARVKALSLSGAAVLVAAFAMQGNSVANGGNKTIWFAEVANVLYWIATSMMAFSFSFFVAASQAVLGDILPDPKRAVVAWATLLPTLTAWKLIPTGLPHRLATDAGLQLCTAVVSLASLFAAGLCVSSARPWIFAPPPRPARQGSSSGSEYSTMALLPPAAASAGV